MTEKETRSARLKRWCLRAPCAAPDTLSMETLCGHDERLCPDCADKARRELVASVQGSTPKARVLNSPFRRFEKVNRDYAWGQELDGAGLTAMRVVTLRRTGQRFACRVMPMPDAEERAHRLLREQVYAEIDLLAHSVEPSVLALREFHIGKSKVYLITELPEGGRLLGAVLRREEDSYTEAKVKVIFMQILAGVAFLHGRGLTHRDLSLDSFVLPRAGSMMDIRIADLGMWEGLYGGKRCSLGTSRYYPPTAIRKHVDKFGRGMDMLSLGVLLYTLLSGEVPFYSPTANGSTYQNLVNGKFSLASGAWGTVTPAAKDLVSKLLVPDNSRRLTARQAMEHPWVCGIVCSLRPLLESRWLLRDQGEAALLMRSCAVACEINRLRNEKARELILRCWWVIGRRSQGPITSAQWSLFGSSTGRLRSHRRHAAKVAKKPRGTKVGEGDARDARGDATAVKSPVKKGGGPKEGHLVSESDIKLELARVVEEGGSEQMRQDSDARDVAFSHAVTAALERRLKSWKAGRVQPAASVPGPAAGPSSRMASVVSSRSMRARLRSGSIPDLQVEFGEGATRTIPAPDASSGGKMESSPFTLVRTLPKNTGEGRWRPENRRSGPYRVLSL
eukprot:evm.model.scf_181EXC.9 EVM.evm.TU.scf_181EXC.9   scf_181EXC:46211-49283(-)